MPNHIYEVSHSIDGYQGKETVNFTSKEAADNFCIKMRDKIIPGSDGYAFVLVYFSPEPFGVLQNSDDLQTWNSQP